MGSVLVAALDSSAGVADEDFNALYTTEIWLVAFLDAEVAGVVAGAVVVVAVDVVLGDLADVAEDIGSCGVLVLPEDALLDEESGEAVELLLEAAVVLG